MKSINKIQIFISNVFLIFFAFVYLIINYLHMRKILLSIIAAILALTYTAEAQEDSELANGADSIYLKCLNETKHYVSSNLLQFVVGTANINYEYMITNRFSMKIGAGKLLGHRFLTNELQYVNTSKNSISFNDFYTGLHYYTIEPRFYTFNSTKNCWMNIAFALQYKFWDYQQNIPKKVENEDTGETTTVYSTKNIQHHQFGASLLGKHPVSGGFTFEYQAGIGVGPKSGTVYVTPNVGFSIGWIF